MHSIDIISYTATCEEIHLAEEYALPIRLFVVGGSSVLLFPFVISDAGGALEEDSDSELRGRDTILELPVSICDQCRDNIPKQPWRIGGIFS
ncbi:MAG: hypothetical protein CMJ78_15370 [Planctomycetaceae bacterium]|nr:hypothetical protein [Planctomycetaceae bacterium]